MSDWLFHGLMVLTVCIALGFLGYLLWRDVQERTYRIEATDICRAHGYHEARQLDGVWRCITSAPIPAEPAQ